MKTAYYHFSTIDSTNNFVKEHLTLFATDTLSLVTADEQTKGRGRFGNSWISPKGNLYLSAVFFPKEKIDAFLATQAASIAIDRLLHEFGIKAKIKWPNDLYVSDKKISGILTEVSSSAIIIGIGLNANLSKNETKLIAKKTTSLALETGLSFDLTDLTHRLGAYLIEYLFETSLVPTLWQEKVSWMIGEEATARKATSSVKGKVVTITKEGTLILMLPTGEKVAIQSGEVITNQE